MRRSIAILSLIIISTLFFTLSAFALTKEEQSWKEDILTLLSLVKRVGDYSEVVDLVEVTPALKKDPEIRKAFITFAPPGATPPEWTKEEEITPPVRKEEARPLTEEEKKEVRKHYLIGKRYYNAQEDEKAIEEFERVLALDPSHKKAIEYLFESHYHPGRKYYKDKDYGKARAAFEKALAKNPEHKKAKEYFAKSQAGIEERARAEEEARRIAQEVTEQKKPLEMEKRPPIEIIKEEPMPPGAKVIYSIDVVSEVKAEIVEGKTKVTITLSGERKYTISDRAQPPSIIVDIPHTINAVSPEIIPINRGGIRMIKSTQHRCLPFDEARIIIVLDKWVEYKVKSKDNEIHIEFQE